MSDHIVKRFDFDSIVAGVLHLIINPFHIEKFHKYIDPEYFFYSDKSSEVNTLREVLYIVIELYTKGQRENIQFSFIENELLNKNKEFNSGLSYRNIFQSWQNKENITGKVHDPSTLEIFSKYLKILQIAKISKDFSEKYQIGDIDDAFELMQKTILGAQDLGKDTSDSFDGNTLEEFLEKMVNNNSTQKLELGCQAIDDYLGGFPQQTLNLMISVTNGGKTMMSHHLVRRCIEQRVGVHIFCVEDRKESFVSRLTSALTGIPMTRLKSVPMTGYTTEERSLIRSAGQKIAQYVKVDFVYGQPVDALHKMALDYDMKCEIEKKTKPLVSIVDYTGHIASKTAGEKGYEKIRNAYAARKDFALKHNKICFDFAQVNRSGNKNMQEDKILNQSDLAGAYDLSQVCDNIISLNRNAEDISSSRIKLHVCKARDGEVGYTASVETDFSCARFNMSNWEWVQAPASVRSAEKKKMKEQQ